MGNQFRFVGVIFSLILFCLSSLFAAEGPKLEADSQNNLTIPSSQALCVFEYVKSRRPKIYDHSGLSAPKVVYSNQISLEEFQKDYLAFQGHVPEIFTNYFNILNETVYLYVGLERYKAPRSPVDSLAHEYVHFFQFIESNRDHNLHKNDYNDDLETEAVRVQTEFRESGNCL